MSSIGADPEAFIIDKLTRQAIPAHRQGLPPKHAAWLLGNGGKVLRDGYAIEFNPTHSTCRYVMSSNFYQVLRRLAGKFVGPNEDVVFQSAMPIDLATLEDAPGDVSEFGCEGAWNAYEQRVLKPEIHGPTHPLRYTGGHIHGSFDYGTKVEWAKDLENVFLWAKMEDRWLGLLTTYIAGSEWLRLRRKYYGQAGEFRLQDHPFTVAAVEYRTPGSEIWSHPALLSLSLGVFRQVYENFRKFRDSYDPTQEKEVRAAIDAGVSHDSLLDLIPDMPGWYSKKLLKRARNYFAPLMHEPLMCHAETYQNWASNRYGWREWCKEQGFEHYRNDYRSNDEERHAPLDDKKLLELNKVWEKEAA